MLEFSSPRRLAGVGFETQPRPLKETLPRMDSAVFVGFAASGPLHFPVVVEDSRQFAAIFGEDYIITTDTVNGAGLRACLAPVVRSFFSNGGRRCWVIRVDNPFDADDKTCFCDNPFLDEDLKDAGSGQLMTQADFLRFQSPAPRRLKGIHAALEIEEATVIAVPDAVHLGWSDVAFDTIVTDPWHKNSVLVEDTSATSADSTISDTFLDCSSMLPPVLRYSGPIDSAGTFSLWWGNCPANALFNLQESNNSGFVDAVTIYEGTHESRPFSRHPSGLYYYRIRIESGGKSSDWSNIISLSITPATQLQKQFNSRHVLDVHRALIRMCAARGDMTAVLGLPYHYQADEAISYVTRLKSTRPQTADGSVPPLSYSEAHAFSYASLFHPWLLSRSNDKTGTFDAIPPDGAICGIFARRSLSRGAWIAPANETLRDVVALAPPIKSERWLPLQESRINLIRREPMGFVTLSADTLSDDSDLRPLNVRRLLILIRKLALKKGEEYVFETNDASFRRMVQHGFEAMLDEMFMRGAFSGATPALAYQVVTGDSLNTTQSVDQGRCIVELKVSPSRPMTFLTVRLMQTGDRMSIVEGA